MMCNDPVLRNKMSSKRTQRERVHTVWFCFYKVQVWIKLVCGVKCQDSGYSWRGRRNSDWEGALWLLSTWNVWLYFKITHPPVHLRSVHVSVCMLNILKCVCVKVKLTQSCTTLCDPMDYTVRGILQARILESGSLSLLQGIFPTQRLNPGLPHCRQILYQLNHKGSPKCF